MFWAAKHLSSQELGTCCFPHLDHFSPWRPYGSLPQCMWIKCHFLRENFHNLLGTLGIPLFSSLTHLHFISSWLLFWSVHCQPPYAKRWKRRVSVSFGHDWSPSVQNRYAVCGRGSASHLQLTIFMLNVTTTKGKMLKEFLEITNVPISLIVVTVSWVYAYIQTHQIA